MQTKPFINMFGSEVQTTRDEFVRRWLAETNKFNSLFYGTAYVDILKQMQDAVQELAGTAWDAS